MALVKVMTSCWTGDKPSLDPMLTQIYMIPWPHESRSELVNNGNSSLNLMKYCFGLFITWQKQAQQPWTTDHSGFLTRPAAKPIPSTSDPDLQCHDEPLQVSGLCHVWDQLNLEVDPKATITKAICTTNPTTKKIRRKASVFNETNSICTTDKNS